MRNLLFPLGALYGAAVWIRNRMFDHGILKSKSYRFPIIGVGNITVGGTGKTPHVEYLLGMLEGHYKAAVVSRGYKRSGKGLVEATEASTSREIGDEPRQIKRKFPRADVIVSASRRKALDRLVEGRAGNSAQVAILDDAFQHRHVKPGLTILLIDYNRPMDEDHILPWGSLRESPAETRRANIVLVTKTPPTIKPIDRRLITKKLALFPYQSLFFTHLEYGAPTSIHNPADTLDLERCAAQGYHILLVTGVASPKPLHDHLLAACPNTTALRYPDHHNYTEKDLARIRATYERIEAERKIVATTEKDAVRLAEAPGVAESGLPIYYIPIQVAFADDTAADFRKKVMAYIFNQQRDGLNA